MPQEKPSQAWTRLLQHRSTVMEDWEEYADWTIPSLIPWEGTNINNKNRRAYTSIGAQLVNHLVGKQLEALFPASISWVQLSFNEQTRQQLAGMQIPPGQIAMMEEALGNAERELQREIATNGFRKEAMRAQKLKIVTGNSLLYYPSHRGEPPICYGPRDWAGARDSDGTPTEIMICQAKLVRHLSPANREKYLADNPEMAHRMDDEASPPKAKLYTWIKLNDGKYDVSQWADDTKLEFEGSYPPDKLDWHWLTWNHQKGEHYARGLIEEYAGDFATYEILNKALTDGVVALSDIKYLVRQGAPLNVKRLTESESGSYHVGNEGDITVVQAEKYMDMRLAAEYLAQVERRLKMVFLMFDGAVRDAERVTRYEVQQQLVDLDRAHAGIYANDAVEWQAPIAKATLQRVDLPLPQGIDLLVMTGLDSLSRASELEALVTAFDIMAKLNGVPEPMLNQHDMNGLLRKIYTLVSLDTSSIVKSPEQMAQEAQAAQQASNNAAVNEAMVKAAPQVAQEEGM